MKRATFYLSVTFLAIAFLAAGAARAQSGAISANPNPCEIYLMEDLCSSTITWSSQGTSSVQVWVSMNGGAETLFSASGSGGPYSEQAGWIQSGTWEPDVSVYSYVFSLYNYSGGNRGARLSQVTVTGYLSIRCRPL